jgi:hypothetical protein
MNVASPDREGMRAAHRRATLTPTNEIAAELQDQLGQRIVAYAAHVRSPKLVGRWAAGAHTPGPDTEPRLRALYRTSLILGAVYRAETIRAWLTGSNPDLGDRTPLDLLHDGEAVEVFKAADAFVEGQE